MKLQLNDIVSSYEVMRTTSRKCINSGNYERAIQLIRSAARTAYLFNWIYSDDDLEEQIQIISKQMLSPLPLEYQKGRFVFYDSFGYDNRGLTQQYVRALIAQGAEFLYVFENESPENSINIRLELEEYEKCEIFSLDQSLPLKERLLSLYRVIYAYRPEKIFMHLSPWAVEALIVFHAFESVIKYQINLTDHAFWLGVRCLDYSLEFRSYGCTISLEKRNLDYGQLLVNPYYPITSKLEFKGFPVETKNRVVMFSGGTFYKIYGHNGCFFHLVKKILDENPEVLILFAGSGEGEEIDKFIRENQLQQRFILIGNRTDINEVVAHCDIYLGTFPITGGLMSQLAATNAKPILAYTTVDIPCNNVEGIVCHKHLVPITFTDEEAFLAEAKRLVSDEIYRLQRGRSLKEAIITATDFNSNFQQILQSNKNIIQFEIESINYESFTNLYLEVENNYQSPFKRLFLKTFRAQAILKLPVIFIKIAPKVLLAEVKKLMARFI